MGLIKQAGQTIANAGKELAGTVGGAALNSVGGVINQAMFKEYFTSGAMTGDIIMKRAEQVKNGSRNTKSDANIITTGSVIDVQPNQCMIIVENGKIVDACTEQGQYVYDNTVAPSFFCGGDSVVDRFKAVAMEMYQQFQFGGQRHSTQRVYFINTGLLDKSIKWGVGNVVFRHTEQLVTGTPLALTIKLKGAGDIRIRMTRPLDFFELYGAKYAGGDNSALITLDTLEEFFAHAKVKLTDAVGRSITVLGSKNQLRYDEISMYVDDVIATINEKMADSDMGKAGFDFSDFVIKDGMLFPTAEDEDKIQKLQEKATNVFDPNMANYDIQKTMAEGFLEAGKNGGVSGVMGMGMAMGGAGAGLGQMQYQGSPYQQPQYQQPQTPQMQSVSVSTPVANANSWTCTCGNTVLDGVFCNKCGSKKPEPKPVNGWTCTCGKTNSEESMFCSGCGSKKPEPQNAGTWNCSCGKVNDADSMFCSGCGSKKPVALNLRNKTKRIIRCDKCGWTSDDIDSHKFCPKCGDPVNEADIVIE
ncbi:MAG: hypothetical protein IJZ79_02820 [Bacilli bacterium]|nr:hypothetical protein [Bacilli bacterium]MBQ8218658.1 hypothetical protein [Bacilli bacterium]